MAFRPEEVSSIIQQELEKHESKLETKSVGSILQVTVNIGGEEGAYAARVRARYVEPADAVSPIGESIYPGREYDRSRGRAFREYAGTPTRDVSLERRIRARINEALSSSRKEQTPAD